MRLRTVPKFLVVGAMAGALVAIGGAIVGTRASSQGQPVPIESSPVRAPVVCDAASNSGAVHADGLFWTVGEHTFRRPPFGFDSCVAALPSLTPDVFGGSKTFAGTDIDSLTGERTLGLWLSDTDGANKRLLVSHGDATAVNDPAFRADGQAIYFTAEHPGHFELHRFDTATSKLDTLLEDPSPILRPVSHQKTDGSYVVAMQVGSCSADAPTNVVVYEGESRTSLHTKVPSLRERWLTPVGWQADGELVVLSRTDSCIGPGDLLIIRSLTVDSRPELVATNVTAAVVQHRRATDDRSRIVLNPNFAAPT